MQNLFQWVVNTLILLVFFAVIAALGLLGAREWFLWRGVESFKNSMQEARRLRGEEGMNCADEFGAHESLTGTTFQQIRFEDDRRYNLELICSGFSDMPVASVPKVLSSFISKAPGSSGISFAEGQSAQYITLRVFGPIVDGLPPELSPILGWLTRSTVVGWDGGAIVEKDPTEVVVNTLGPVAECGGYGYTCCDATSQVGEGLSIQNLNSCPGGCFERCARRPLVQSLRTDPSVDWETKQVEIPSGESVKFVWGIEDDPAAGPWQIALDLGDGSTETSDLLESFVDHSFSCDQAECVYDVSLVVTNAKNIASTPSDVSKIQVRVVGQSE